MSRWQARHAQAGIVLTRQASTWIAQGLRMGGLDGWLAFTKTHSSVRSLLFTCCYCLVVGGERRTGRMNRRRRTEEYAAKLLTAIRRTLAGHEDHGRGKEQKASCRPISGTHTRGTKKLTRAKPEGSRARTRVKHGRASIVDLVGGWCERPAWRAGAGKRGAVVWRAMQRTRQTGQR
jgi:hypothetical protein